VGGNTKGRRRRFGAVRQLRSSRWQARYLGPDGVMRPADDTFASKTEAERWLTRTEAAILDSDWIDPEAGKISLESYVADWIAERPNLRPKTVALYRYLARNHLVPRLGSSPVSAISDGRVRRWRRELLDSGVSPVTTAKAYRLLKAILNTATDDGLIRRNPCRIKGASQERSPERPMLSIDEVYKLADAVGDRYRALVLLTAFGSLRWGEAIALQRADVDLDARTVRVDRQLTEVPGAGLVLGQPKSDAGRRVIHLPEAIIPVLREHLEQFGNAGLAGLVFSSPTGLPLRHSQFRNRVWLPALAQTGLKGVHFHDLRHAGNGLAAATGATLRELMARMGHSSTRAALIYLHNSDERQRWIAEGVDALLRGHLASEGRPPGTAQARQSGADLAQGGADDQLPLED
jgi:integrase